jgi:hypothetical protein
MDTLNQQLFTEEFVTNATYLIISRFLKLSQEDLESWEDDPEQFVQEEESDYWLYKIRPW